MGSVFDVMRERIFYSLIADISGNPYYITSRKVEQIAYMIQHASDWDVPSDLQTHKLYESLIEKIKKADIYKYSFFIYGIKIIKVTLNIFNTFYHNISKY